MIQSYAGVPALLHEVAPAGPVVGFRPHVIAARARNVLESFPGDVLYAVKCNEHPAVLEALYEGGIREFDTASIAEIRQVRSLFADARCHFMHPVKCKEAIAEAYFTHAVRRFVFDHPRELEKILEATEGADDLELFVRVAVPGEGAMLTLTGKFGATPDEAAVLLRHARKVAAAAGVTFHVGSQCLEPEAFARAIRIAADVARAGGGIDYLDVGGGFPARYLGHEPDFEAFVAVIEATIAETGLDCRLQCEPGRALVAEGASVLTKVELRRGSRLYVNDGVYGNLAELKWIGPQFPLKLVRPEKGEMATRRHGNVMSFDLYGPTCDSIDSMPGPHWLPADIREDDWIEVGMMGAYSTALRTGFNGFAATLHAFVEDPAWYAAEAGDDPLSRAA